MKFSNRRHPLFPHDIYKTGPQSFPRFLKKKKKMFIKYWLRIIVISCTGKLVANKNREHKITTRITVTSTSGGGGGRGPRRFLLLVTFFIFANRISLKLFKPYKNVIKSGPVVLFKKPGTLGFSEVPEQYEKSHIF